MIINKRLKVYKIVLVGCGNIGFRYYQSLSKLNLNIELSIFDKQKKRYNNFLQNALIPSQGPWEINFFVGIL